MGLKVTIQVDGQTEQLLAPVIGQVLAQYPELIAGAVQARLQPQVAENPPRRLIAPGQTISAPAPAVSEHPVEHTAQPVGIQRPALPAQYQPGQREIARHWLQRSATGTARLLWQGLVWVAFGQAWLALVLLLGAVTVTAWRLAPEVVNRFWSHPEFIESIDALPGETIAPDTIEPDAPKAPTATGPSSKAGSHPPPPPAFQ